MNVLVTCMNKHDPIKNESQNFYHCKSVGIFSDAEGLLWEFFQTLKERLEKSSYSIYFCVFFFITLNPYIHNMA